MHSFSLPNPARLSALLFVSAWVGVDAQTPGVGASSICDGQVTVTYVPPPFTVTIFTTGTFNVSDFLPSPTSLDVPTSGLSGLPGVTSLGISGLGSGIPTFSPTIDVSLPGGSLSSGVIPTSLSLPSDLSGIVTTGPLLSTTPSVGVSVPTVSMSLTQPSLTIPTTISPGGVITSDLASGLTSLLTSNDVPLPTLSSLNSISLPTLSSLGISSLSDFSLPGNTLPSSLPTLSTPAITLPTTSIPTVQLSSLSSVLSGSVTLPGLSLSSGLTTLISSVNPSLSLPTLSPSLPTLSFSGTLSVPSTSLVIPTGPSISLSSVTASLGLPSTSLSVSLSSISVSLPGGIPTLIPTAASTRTTSLATPIPTASILALVYCPSDDGLNYLSPGNRAYQVECNRRRLGNALSEEPAPDLQSCINSCDDIPGCQSVSYNPTYGNCYSEDDSSTGSPDSNFLSASAVDLSCPGADTTQYMDYTGSVYQVYCDYNFPQSSNITTVPGDDYLECSAECSKTSTCTGFSYSNGVCTLTQGFGDTAQGARRNGTNTVVLIAKRAVRVGPDGKPIVDTVPVTSAPRLSISSIYTPTINITGLPSTLSLPTISSILTLPSTISLPTITSIDASSLLNVTTILSIPSLTTPTILLSSAVIPTSQGPTQTPIAYSCPSSDGRVVVENGLSYVLNCSSATDGTAYSSKEAASSFNDCFRECDQSSVVTGAKYCTAFTYEGAANGSGMGTCYLYNGVSQSFMPSNGRNTITAIRAVNYLPAAVVGGVSSLLSTVTGLSVTLPVGVSATIAVSVTAGAGVSVNSPSVSNPVGGISSPTGSLVTISTPASIPITTCDNGGNVLNGCVAVTATVNPSVGVSGGVVLGPSSSPILSLGVSASAGLSVSASVGLGLGVSAGSSGTSLGLDPSVGLGMSGGLGGGLGGGSAPSTTSISTRASATPGAGSGSALPSTTSYYVTPMGPVVTTTTTATPSLSTTTVFTTSTVTSCLTGVGGTLTCPLGGLFTTLPSTSGAVTSISTSVQTSISVSIQTSVSVSVSISYITVTAPSTTALGVPYATPLTLSTITTFSTRPSTNSSSAASTSTCRGVVNALGACVL